MRKMHQPLLNGIRFCKLCGARMLFQGYHEEHRISMLMHKHKICYECAWWEEFIKFPLANSEVVNGKVLKICPEIDKKEKHVRLGGKGKLRYFYLENKGISIRSNDVWAIATVPERFRDRVPDTAIELSNMGYTKTKDKKRCYSKACYDRYNCFRYNIQKEIKEGGPYNTIPGFWKPGASQCKYFLSKHNPLLIKAVSKP